MGEETKATGMPRGIPVPKNLENRQEQFFRKKGGGGEKHATVVRREQGERRETQRETSILAETERNVRGCCGKQLFH